MKPVLALAALLAAGALAPGRSFAGAPEDEVKSRQLFKDADKLAADGRWKEACSLFQAAHDLNSTGGTAMRTADCYEKIADYDRALGMYQWVVEHRAADKNHERVKIAENRVEALKKQLAKDQPPPVVQKPPVEQHPLPPPPPTSAPEVPPPPPNRVPAFVSFGVGGAGLVLGAVFGGLAMAQASGVKSDAQTRCPTSTCNDPDLDSRKSAAITKGWVANIGFGVAVAGAVTGIVLLATASSPKAEQQRAVQKAQSFVTPEGLRIRF
jgi:hypothetical protein